MANILLIDDDDALAEALEMYLTPNNHELRHALVPSRAFTMLAQQVPDLILLDVMLPEQDGFSVCREIRAGETPYTQVPIIMLTARGDITDKVVGLELGADDYLPKPFEPRELLARINSLLRRSKPVKAATNTGHTEPGLFIEKDKRRVWLDGDLLELSTLEYELLVLLLSEPGKNWSRDEIMSRLKGTDAMLYSRAVDTLVSRLRQRLGDTSKQPRFIKTVWGRGYTFLQ